MDSLIIIANFVMPDSVVPFQINELYFNNKSNYDCGDWIEFYYYGIEPLDISNYQIKGLNDKLLYTFDKGSIINPREYFIVAQDVATFKKVFPESIRCFGNFVDDILTQGVLLFQDKEGATLNSLEYMTDPEQWPLLPPQGYSIELNAISDDPDSGSNWNLSENTFGSPGISNASWYTYHDPSGKDVLFDGTKETILPFSRASNLYFDPDGHQLAAVTVTSVSGPGEIWVEGEELKEGSTYNPTDFFYYPAEDNDDSITVLNYRFIDYSGGKSLEHSVVLMNLPSGLTPSKTQDVNVFPVPSEDYCFIQMPGEETGNAIIRIFDMSGNHICTEETFSDQGLIKLSLSGYRNGMYVFILRFKENMHSGRLLIQHE
jgi:hypothetical protein